MILRIAHIASAVKSGGAALKLYQHVLGLRLDGSETVQSEGVKTTFSRRWTTIRTSSNCSNRSLRKVPLLNL